MDKVLASYAVLDYFSDKHKDIIDMYVPLFVRVICQYQLQGFEREKIRNLFVQEYGLTSITFGAIDTILNRMCHADLLSRENGIYYTNDVNILKIKFPNLDSQIEQSFDDIIRSIQSYSKNKFSLTLTESEIVDGFFEFLDSYNVDVVLDLAGLSVRLSQIKNRKVNLKFIISKFITDNQNKIDILIRIAKGYLLSQTVSLDNLSSYKGKMKDVKIVLDAPIIYNLLGLNSKANLDLANELLSQLKEQSAIFCIFRHNYNEVLNTLKDASHRLRSKDYDLSKSSRVLVYAVSNHLDANYIQLQISKISDLFQKWDFSIIDAPASVHGYEEIDECQLEENIKDIYKQHGNGHLPKYVEDLITVDVRSLSYVFRFHGNEMATSLKNCKALLLTTNKAIAFASSDASISLVSHNIPVCVTDVFLSTILWLNFPKKNDILNKKLMLSLCANNINIDNVLLAKYYKKIEEMLAGGTLTKEQVAELTTSNIAIRLLEQKTMNSLELFTDMTPLEVLQDIENVYVAKIKYNEQRNNQRERRYLQIANVISKLIYWMVWSILFFLFLLKGVFGLLQTGYNFLDCFILCPVGLFLSLWGIFNWGGLIPTRSEIIGFLSKRIYLFVRHKLEGD